MAITDAMMLRLGNDDTAPTVSIERFRPAKDSVSSHRASEMVMLREDAAVVQTGGTVQRVRP